MIMLKYMTKSSTRGIFLSITLLFSLLLIVIPSNANAQEINVKSFAFEETTIIEFTNDSDEEIDTFRIWLGSDFNFKSFKTEKGWVGEKTPLGVIIFTSSETIKPGESVKFGVKTDKVKPGINWKALDKVDNVIDTGKVLSGELPKVIQNTEIKQDQILGDTGTGISTESIFRIVPEKPNVGSSIRVTGDEFGASQEFDFYIDSKKVGSFETDEDGHFMTTMKIPDDVKIPNDEKDVRVSFIIKDKDGQQKELSFRIGEVSNRIVIDENIPLKIKNVPSVIHPGDVITYSGTGTPGSSIITTVFNADEDIVNTIPLTVDNNGNWSHEASIPLLSDFGNYRVEVSFGEERVSRVITVESSEKILIIPSNIKFVQGSIMTFNGTGLPNQDLEIILENPQGNEIFSNVINVGEKGFIEFEIPTTFNDVKGTYVLFASQGDESIITFVGLGVIAEPKLVLKMDKLNYMAQDIANILVEGPPTEKVTFIILNPSDKEVYTNSTTIGQNGKVTHSFSLEGYSSGVYTAIARVVTTTTDELFSVGLQTGSGQIEINTTKIPPNYLPGDPILILGNTSPSVILVIILTDPDGNEVKVKETFSDKFGKISESSFRIPSDGVPGMWTINARSDKNFDIREIEVLATLQEGIQVFVGDSETLGIHKIITIKVIGAQQTVEIEIIAEDGEIIDTLSFQASSQGEIIQPWIIDDQMKPGIYTVKVKDAFDSAETTFKFQ